MNILRRQVCSTLRRPIARQYVTARPFVPPSQLDQVDPFPPRRRGRGRRKNPDEEELDEEERNDEISGPKAKPESQSFYTGRAIYHDNLIQLQNAISRTRGTLKTLQLLPLPPFARESLIQMQTAWKTPDELAREFDTNMTTGRYRRVTALLNELHEYYRIAVTAKHPQLADMIDDILRLFTSGKKNQALAQGKRKKVQLDQYGRSYTVGKRKTSSARVWMIPVKTPLPSSSLSSTTLPVEDVLGLSETERLSIPVPTSTILINNLPIAEYFPQPADRERIVYPLKVAGVLGKYNIFTIARGGGTTGQSGAIAHGIAKGIFAHESDVGDVLRRAKLLRRDPRMVERKKTGLAKARKRYTWVKR
ncbi:SSU ribosomal protein S9P [Dendrothele bispora CBS 962.96]|uniref:SSU ribosomal protein S9P n=1 Tax=Dendrothele bispora (strain CBS 962.96) TaxID=1314807 RepID=A0A4S8MI92_DENBC|nr:SSU ribosomal protein S9P [Dendrothele bispora CBS 962.96]